MVRIKFIAKVKLSIYRARYYQLKLHESVNEYWNKNLRSVFPAMQQVVNRVNTLVNHFNTFGSIKVEDSTTDKYEENNDKTWTEEDERKHNNRLDEENRKFWKQWEQREPLK